MADIKLFIIIVLAILVSDVIRYFGQIAIVAMWTNYKEDQVEDQQCSNQSYGGGESGGRTRL